MHGDTLVVWFENGRTALFNDVTNLHIDEYGGELTFEYFGKSTNTRRYAFFNGVAGYALSSPLPERDISKED